MEIEIPRYTALFQLNLEFDKKIKINFKTKSNNEDSLSFETTKFGWGGGTVLPDNHEKVGLCSLTLNLKEELSDSANDFKFGTCHYIHHAVSNLADKFIVILNLEKKNFSWIKDSYFKEGNNYISELRIRVLAKIEVHPISKSTHEVTKYEFEHRKK